MSTPRYLLVNCRNCDDLIHPVGKARSCECGRVVCSERDDGRIVLTGAALIFALRWESYDAARPGEHGDFEVLSSPDDA